MPELIPAEPGSPEWLAARRAGVTATDIVTIIGLSRWDSPYSLFWRKMGQVPDEPNRDRWELGKALEPYAMTRWANTGTNWQDFVRWPGGLYRHTERAWQMATPDRVLGPFSDLEPCVYLGVLELKSWADADKRAWGQGQVFDDDGTLLVHDDQIPPAIRAQVLWQMDTMDVAVGHVGVVFLPSGEFRSYTIEHGPHVPNPHDPTCRECSDLYLMRRAGEEFMARLRLELPPPDPDSSAATLAAVRARFARVPAKQAEIDRWVFAQWLGARDSMAEFEAKARGLEIELREQAGEAAEYTVDGQLVARRVVSDAQVKAHTRHMDYLKRVKNGDDSD